MNEAWKQLGVMILVTYATRVIPLFLIHKPIQNPFIKSFLYYVPFVTLAMMTFPSIVFATKHPLSGLLAFIVGVVLAWKDKSLFYVSLCCCFTVFVVEMFYMIY